MITSTYIAKAIEATKGKTLKQLRGFFDQASKNVVADRQILARIVRECVWEARRFSVAQLEQLIPADVYISATPVFRDDAAAEDPGPVRQDNTEDGSVQEGVVRFDIMFTLKLPGEKEPILLVINVEIQNTDKTHYPLESRGIEYACRLVGRQGPDYGHIKKAYSIWIVTNTKHAAKENTAEIFVVAKRRTNGRYEAAPKSAQLFEVCFLYLGESEKAGGTGLLHMLDLLFSTSIDVREKKDMLREQYGVRMSREVTDNMGIMLDMELAIEAKARREGEKKGRKEGSAEGIMIMGLAAKQPRPFIMKKLEDQFGNPKKAQSFFDKYVAAHPEEGSYLDSPESESAGK